jgi:hypothetical protein
MKGSRGLTFTNLLDLEPRAGCCMEDAMVKKEWRGKKEGRESLGFLGIES